MLEITKVGIEQKKELQEICRLSYAQVFADHWTENGLELYLDEQFNLERLESELSNEDYQYFMVIKENRTIGFAKMNYTNSPELSKSDNCELEKIYILPEFSGSGIGKSVMKELFVIAKNLGKQFLFLCVLDTNENAIAFYKKLGFQYHSSTKLEASFFKEELKGMYRMVLELESV